MSAEGLRVARDERGVLRLTLDRPEKRNAITDAMMAGLLGEIEAAGTDENVRAIVLDGAGASGPDTRRVRGARLGRGDRFPARARV